MYYFPNISAYLPIFLKMHAIEPIDQLSTDYIRLIYSLNLEHQNFFLNALKPNLTNKKSFVWGGMEITSIPW